MEEAGGLAGLAAQLSLPPSNLEFRQSAVSKGNDDDDSDDDNDDVDQVAEYGPGTCLCPREPDLDLFWASGSLSRRMMNLPGR